MAEKRRSASQTDYDPVQRLILALFIFDIWDGAGFAGMFDGDGRRFMPRLLVGSCIAAMKERPMSITEAFAVMDTTHGRTANKYIDVAQDLGFLKKEADPDGDGRKQVLVPTRLLKEKFGAEMARIGDDMRELIAALLHGGDGLPTTGAPNLSLIGPYKNANRHTDRVESRAHLPMRREIGGTRY